ncbi:MAG: hypothetical protein AAF485_32610, partial [Chloroflexota bacterium]
MINGTSNSGVNQIYKETGRQQTVSKKMMVVFLLSDFFIVGFSQGLGIIDGQGDDQFDSVIIQQIDETNHHSFSDNPVVSVDSDELHRTALAPLQTITITTKTDVVLLMDVSGSMEFETICYGCYSPYDGVADWTTITNTLYPNPDYYNPIPINHLPTSYPDGYAGSNTGQLCSGPTAYHTVSGGNPTKYIVIEAELYSRRNQSIYDIDVRAPGQGYWAVQHSNDRTIHNMEGATWDPDGTYDNGAHPILSIAPYTDEDRGSWVSHHPFVSWAGVISGTPLGFDYTLGQAQANQS